MRTGERRLDVGGFLLAVVLGLGLTAAPALVDAGHDHGPVEPEAGQAMPGHGAMSGGGTAGTVKNDAPTMLLMPIMDPARGRKVYAAKGCVICHALNGIGGDHGPSLDMSGLGAMNPFDFAAKIWEGAEAMIVLQEEELGERIQLTGQDLADMTAFVHSPSEISKFSKKDIPHKIWDVLQKTHGKGHAH